MSMESCYYALDSSSDHHHSDVTACEHADAPLLTDPRGFGSERLGCVHISARLDVIVVALHILLLTPVK